MKWFLTLWVVFGQGGDPGIIQGYVAPTRMVMIEMPSLEICEAVKALNKFQQAECWGKKE